MARRGDTLREHILWTAKDVFLEAGFERASMDVVAIRAQTSKRSLYAHYESKEKLFLVVIELARGLFLDRLRTPGDYADEPAEALALFCGRYLEVLLYEGWVRLLRVSMAEAERFPEQAAQCFDVAFTQVRSRLGDYLRTTFDLSAEAATEAAQDLMGRILHPRLARALLGLDALAPSFDRDVLSPDFDLTAVRLAVAKTIETLRKL